MGNVLTTSRPYIIDEFDSEDDLSYESAVEGWDFERVKEACIDKDEEIQRKRFINEAVSPVEQCRAQRGLEHLLMYLDNNDFEGARKAANSLRQDSWSCSLSGSCSALPASNLKSFAGETSSWNANSTSPSLSTTSHVTVLRCSEEADQQRQILEQLDKDLSQFEAAEERIAREVSTSHQSQIPRLRSRSRSSSLSRDGDGHESRGGGEAHRRKSSSDRQRGVSPKTRSSGIPRYGGSSQPAVRCHIIEPETEHQTEESLRTESRGSLVYISNKPKPPSVDKADPAAWDINISDVTGRAKKNKKRSGIPSVWTKGTEDGTSPPSESGSSLVQTLGPTSSEEMMRAEEMRRNHVGVEYCNLVERKVLDLRRWYCISRPQYKTSCGISSVVSCWNYLFSTLGHGSLKPLTQETAMNILGFEEPFENIKFGPFTGNLTLLRWFRELSNHFHVRGQCFYMYKPIGRNSTPGVTEELALATLKQGLNDSNTTFIYHCHNHYFCPIGYEVTPQLCTDAYKGEHGEVTPDTWVLIGDTSRRYPSIHCKRWEEIYTDLRCQNPDYFNIRESWKGVMQREKIKKTRGNLHCILTFQKISDNTQESPSSTNSSSGSSKSQIPRSSRLPVRPGSSSPPVESSPSGLSPVLASRSPMASCKPELNNVNTNLEEDEVGAETLDSEDSDDGVVENDDSGVGGTTDIVSGSGNVDGVSGNDDVSGAGNGVGGTNRSEGGTGHGVSDTEGGISGADDSVGVSGNDVDGSR